jgi:hypothetical protein
VGVVLLRTVVGFLVGSLVGLALVGPVIVSVTAFPGVVLRTRVIAIVAVRPSLAPVDQG